MKVFFTAVLLAVLHVAGAATVDTVTIYSHAMKKNKKCIVISPRIEGQKVKPVPVVYLLHGYEGDYTNWITRVPQLAEYADRFRLMIVCPDGGYSSWYLDSPADPTMCYETYIGREVPAWIDSNYHTIKHRSGRAITGLSMGGHGALFIAFRNASFFGACGSMSGVLDLNFSGNKYDLSKRIGDTVQHRENWRKYSMIHVIDHKPSDSLAILFDCGVDDFFYPVNKRMHEKMLQNKIPHDYIERPGKHNWEYWGNAVFFQLFYFSNYFNQQEAG